jgi:hypothetical protein
MSVQPSDDTDEMCRRIMYVLLHEINLQPQTIEFNKDVVWEAASSISGVFKEYGLGLKDTVFQALVQQQDIVDLGETVLLLTRVCVDRKINLLMDYSYVIAAYCANIP